MQPHSNQPSYEYHHPPPQYPQNQEYTDLSEFEEFYNSSDGRAPPTSPSPRQYRGNAYEYAQQHPGYARQDPAYETYQDRPYYAPQNQQPYPAQISSSSDSIYDEQPPLSNYGRAAPAPRVAQDWRNQPTYTANEDAYISRQSAYTSHQGPSHLQSRAPPQIAKPPYQRPLPAAPPVETEQPRNKHGISLRPVSALPDIYRSIFKFGVFNAMQSKCYDTALDTDENMVISAPTGSGKTVLFELAIVRLLMDGDASAKCVYMAPTKALCSERFEDWTAKFQGLGVRCCELTGDTYESGRNAWSAAKQSTIIITTPEKWDSLTRNWSGNSVILAQMKLFLVDEVHILNETRGSTLEVCLARMRLRGSSVRFVLVSATVPNIEDVAAWIGKADIADSGSATVLKFGEEFRPCPIRRVVYGYPRKQNEFQFNSSLDYKVFDVLRDHVEQKPALIFCATRKSVFSTAEQIAKQYKALVDAKEQQPWPLPKRIDATFHDKTLHELVQYGVGVHHAGVHFSDRKAIEHLFTQKMLRVVVATSTLAVGVNFPAHTVVIKGTRQWTEKGWVEYSDLDVMQMIGRAGRPQFDKEGLAIIMTESGNEAKYNALAAGRTHLESSLHVNLTEHINSEIQLGTISNTETAKEWLHCSFLYQRLQKNPRHYGMGKGENQSWESRLDDLVEESVKNLEAAELITVEDGGRRIIATEYGEVMSKYYIRFSTMCSILKLPENAGLREILEMISNAEEYRDTRMRAGERQVLDKIKLDENIRFRLKTVGKVADKVFLLLQAVLGSINLNAADYKTPDAQAPHLEAMTMFKHAPKLAKATADIGIIKRNGHHIKFGMELMRSLNARAWEDRAGVLKQVDQIGDKSVMTLSLNGINDIASLRKESPAKLEHLMNRNAPFGRDILASVKALPNFSLSLEEADIEPSVDNRPVVATLRVHVSATCEAAKKKKGKPAYLGMTSILSLTSDLEVVDFRRIPTKILMEDSRSFDIEALLTKPSQSVTTSISADNFAGLTVTQVYKPHLAPTQYPTMDTRPTPPDSTILEDDPLQGLDQETFWETFQAGDEEDFLDLTEDNPQIDPAPIKSRNIIQPTRDDRKEMSTHGTKLPNGKYTCNHNCKNKSQCRHLCCREGIPGKAAKPDRLTGPDTSVSTERNQPAIGSHAAAARQPVQNRSADKHLSGLGKLDSTIKPISNLGRSSSAKFKMVSSSREESTLPSPESVEIVTLSDSEAEEDLPDVDSAIQDIMHSRYAAVDEEDEEDQLMEDDLAYDGRHVLSSSSPLAAPRTPTTKSGTTHSRLKARQPLGKPTSIMDGPPPAKRRKLPPAPTSPAPVPSQRRDASTTDTAPAPSGRSMLSHFANPALKPTVFREFSNTRSDCQMPSNAVSPVPVNDMPLFLPTSEDIDLCGPGKEEASQVASDLDMPLLLDTVCEIVPSDDETTLLSARPFELSDGWKRTSKPDIVQTSDEVLADIFNSDDGVSQPDQAFDNSYEDSETQADPGNFDENELVPIQQSPFDFIEPVNFGSAEHKTGSQSLDSLLTMEEEATVQPGQDPWADFDAWINDPNNVSVT